MTKRPKTLPAVTPNAGVADAYRKELVGMVDDLHRSMATEVLRGMKNTGLAQDGPVDILNGIINRVASSLLSRLNSVAERMAERFTASVQQNADVSLFASMRDAGLTVKMNMTEEMADAYDAVRAENVALIKSIPEQYHRQVEVLVNESVARGRDLKYLADELHKRYGITRRRAEFIARDQNDKAASTLTAARQRQQGFTQGEWMHSHAGKEPRASHVHANGKTFDLAKGMKIDGEYIMPGQLINCRCTWAPVIPDL